MSAEMCAQTVAAALLDAEMLDMPAAAESVHASARVKAATEGTVEPDIAARARALDAAARAAHDREHRERAANIGRWRRFARALPLHLYRHRLHTVPRVVNVVACLATEPVGDSAVLPINLRRLVAKLPGSFYAPRRFASAQIGVQNFASSQRTRALVFRSGQVVLTGSKSVAASRLAALVVLRRLREEARDEEMEKKLKDGAEAVACAHTASPPGRPAYTCAPPPSAS